MKRSNTALYIVVAMLAIVIACFAGMSFGSVSIPIASTYAVILEGLGINVGGEVSAIDRTILERVRIPRVLLLAIVGAALAACGAVLQSTFQNPMADPGILGISGGGALGAVVATHTGLADWSMLALPACAFAGAILTTMAVFFLSHLGGRPSTTSLLLTGVALSALTGASVSLVLVISEEYQLREILMWLVGSAHARSWSHVTCSAPIVIVGITLLCMRHREIDALALGDEQAVSVGVEVGRARFWLLTLTALVGGTAVSVAGPIGFVGLMVPNGVRLLAGAAAGRTVALSALVGGAFLVLCDLLARSVGLTFELPVGIVTAFLGVPYFLWLLTRSRRLSS
jgi:iron complex transport system permease protein